MSLVKADQLAACTTPSRLSLWILSHEEDSCSVTQDHLRFQSLTILDFPGTMHVQPMSITAYRLVLFLRPLFPAESHLVLAATSLLSKL